MIDTCYLNTSILRFDPSKLEPASGSDALILDLEDAVHIRDKARARSRLSTLDVSGVQPEGLTIGVRINSIRTQEGFLDIAALFARSEACLGRLSFIQLPKVEDKSDVEICRSVLSSKFPSVKIIPIIETPAGVEAVDRIAAVSDAMMFGRVDLSASLYRANPAYVAYARGKFCAACARHSIAAIDTANFSTRSQILDAAEFELDCLAALEEGFTSRAVVHPNQIPVAKRVFTAPLLNIAEHDEVIEQYNQAQMGFSVSNDRIIAPPFVAHAKMMLRLYRPETTQW